MKYEKNWKVSNWVNCSGCSFCNCPPAHAGNVWLSKIDDEGLKSACIKALPGGTGIGDISFKRADTNVNCRIKIDAKGTSKVNAEANLKTSMRRIGAGVGVESTFQTSGSGTSRSTDYHYSPHLSKYCQQKHAPNGYFFNPFNGVGRIFVAEGGNACHKTES